MPIYEFKCGKCGGFFELLVFPGDEPTCPECGSRDIEKAISACVARTSGEDGYSTGSAGCSSCKGGNCATCRPGGS